jgi:hypothetical protein
VEDDANQASSSESQAQAHDQDQDQVQDASSSHILQPTHIARDHPIDQFVGDISRGV